MVIVTRDSSEVNVKTPPTFGFSFQTIFSVLNIKLMRDKWDDVAEGNTSSYFTIEDKHRPLYGFQNLEYWEHGLGQGRRQEFHRRMTLAAHIIILLKKTKISSKSRIQFFLQGVL